MAMPDHLYKAVDMPTDLLDIMATPGHLCYLLALPNELLDSIVKELWRGRRYYCLEEQQLTNIRAVRLTCRRLEAIAKPLLYREITVTSSSALTRFTKHMLNRRECQGFVETFRTMDVPRADSHALCPALPTFTNIRHLYLNSGVGEDLLGTLPMRFDLLPKLYSFFLFNHSWPTDGSVQIGFSKLLPLLATQSLRRFSLCGYDVDYFQRPPENPSDHSSATDNDTTSQDSVQWPHLPRDLPDLLEVVIQNTNWLSGIGKPLRALRGTDSLTIRGGCEPYVSLQHELIAGLASQLKKLNFYDHRLPQPIAYDLRHFRKLEQLAICETTLACLRADLQSHDYIPEDPEPRLLLQFPMQLKQLTLQAQSDSVHRPTFYRVLIDMMEQHTSIFPSLSRLIIICYHFEFNAAPADYHPDTHHPHSNWARNWNHNRIAVAENGFTDPEEGDETAECVRLRAVCEDKGVTLVLRNLMTYTIKDQP